MSDKKTICFFEQAARNKIALLQLEYFYELPAVFPGVFRLNFYKKRQELENKYLLGVDELLGKTNNVLLLKNAPPQASMDAMMQLDTKLIFDFLRDDDLPDEMKQGLNPDDFNPALIDIEKFSEQKRAAINANPQISLAEIAALDAIESMSKRMAVRAEELPIAVERYGLDDLLLTYSLQ